MLALCVKPVWGLSEQTDRHPNREAKYNSRFGNHLQRGKIINEGN